MDAGLGTLDLLKQSLLPVKQQDRADFDAFLTTLGKGVARRFDRYCNRHLVRQVGAVAEYSGDSNIVGLPGYPLEDVTQVEHREDASSSWTVCSDAVKNWSPDSGVLILNGPLGYFETRIRVTYTGGYWYDATGTDTLPAGATELPDDLRLAWLEECAAWWSQMDHTGKAMADATVGSLLAQHQLSASVTQALDPFRRIAY